MSAGWERDREELVRSLNLQCKAIAASAKSYDEGEHWESLRIANSVYILFHDGTGRSVSILTQLGIKNSTKFVSSVEPKEAKPGAFHLLGSDLTFLRNRIGQGAVYLPLLDECRDELVELSFEDWWNNHKIYKHGTADIMSRRELVFALRNKDGGSHLDSEIEDSSYLSMSKHHPISATDTSGKPSQVQGLELAIMRQIAWETIETISRLDLN